MEWPAVFPGAANPAFGRSLLQAATIVDVPSNSLFRTVYLKDRRGLPAAAGDSCGLGVQFLGASRNKLEGGTKFLQKDSVCYPLPDSLGGSSIYENRSRAAADGHFDEIQVL